MSDSISMLTTLDNPFNPFTQYDEWYEFDVSNDYNTCAYLARIACVSNDLSEEQERQVIEKAMNEIVSLNITGNYVKVQDNTFVDRSGIKP